MTNEEFQELKETEAKVQEIFDKAWEENMAGRGTDVSRLCTDRLPAVMQTLAYFIQKEELNHANQ